MSIVNAWDFDIDNVKISKMRVSKEGKKAIYISDAITGEPLRVRFPKLKTFGYADYEGNKDYKLSMILTAEDEMKAKSREFLVALDRKVRQTAIDSSVEWFGKQKSEEMMDEMYSSILKYPKDKTTKLRDYTRDPTFGAKLGKVKDSSPEAYQVEVFNHEAIQVYPNPERPDITPHDLTPQYSDVAVVVSMSSIWFVKSEFGVSVRLLQTLIGEQKPPVIGTGICHLKEFASPSSSSSSSSSSSIEGLPSTCGTANSILGYTEEDDGIVISAQMTALSSLKKRERSDEEPSAEDTFLESVDESELQKMLDETAKKSKPEK